MYEILYSFLSHPITLGSFPLIILLDRKQEGLKNCIIWLTLFYPCVFILNVLTNNYGIITLSASLLITPTIILLGTLRNNKLKMRRDNEEILDN